jgi:hypothetical protein
MADIYIGLIILYAFSIAMLLAGVKIARSAPHWLTIILLLLALGLLFYSGTRWHDNLYLARALPLSNVVVIGDVLPIEGALMIGLAWPLIAGGVRRKLILIVPLVAVALYQANWPLFSEGPQVGNRWRDGVCRQTTKATCAPAAAATLLQYCSIPTSEAEMARLCLTSTKGTSLLGLYRGLKLKTHGSAWQPRPFVGTLAELKELRAPVILSVGLERGANVDPRYERHYGWVPGISHTVVLFDILPDDKLLIGDPATGREVWSATDLSVLWRGQAIYLAKR